MTDFNLDREVPQLEQLVTEFYDALFDDVIIGFLFQPHDKRELVVSQMKWLRAHLGDRAGVWDGASIRAIHQHLPILSGMFDRRHQILVEVLDRWDVPDVVREEWLTLDASLRPLVLNLGAIERDRILGESE